MKYTAKQKAVLVLEDGTVFYGHAAGKIGTATGEICFNTGMTGYQEIFTDPSYYGQIMVMTNAHIGNYGTSPEEVESDSVKIAGLVCKNFSTFYSREEADKSLPEYFEDEGVVGISDIDTRALVSYIRDKGAMNAIVSSDELDIDKLKAQLAEVPSMAGLELSSKVSTKEPYYFGSEDASFRVAVLDIGVKKNILRCLAERGCYLKVYPHNSTLEQMQEFEPDGYMISNGPGDPSAMTDVAENMKAIINSGTPVFGICLGHQIISVASGLETYKMHNGHRGINHPVKNLKTGKAEVTSQNHGFTVDEKSIESNDEVLVTHVNLNDNTIEGIRLKDKQVFSVQYHPEASPGPHDAAYLFDEFIAEIRVFKNEAVETV